MQQHKSAISTQFPKVGFCRKVLEKDGAAEGTRTPDPIITNDVLYQLSYSGILLCAGPTMALLTIQPPA